MRTKENKRPKGRSHVGLDYISPDSGKRLFNWQWIHPDGYSHINVHLIDGLFHSFDSSQQLEEFKWSAIWLAKYYHRKRGKDEPVQG